METKPNTVRVTIWLAIDKDKQWCAAGHSRSKSFSDVSWILDDLDGGELRYKVVVDVEPPRWDEVEGVAEDVQP